MSGWLPLRMYTWALHELATARDGSMPDTAPSMDSTMAITVAMRALHAAGGFGFTSVPEGRTTSRGRKEPSLTGMSGETRQRAANSTPDSDWETEALIGPLA